MSIERIIKLMPVPENTCENIALDWSGFLESVDLRLPDIFVQFVSTYGTGSVGNFLWILNPFSKNPSLNWQQSSYFRDSYQNLRLQHPQYYPHDRGDFLPWAFTDNGDAIVWRVMADAQPNDWKVCIQASNPSTEEKTELNTQEFIEALLRNELSSSVLPNAFLVDDKPFVPA